LAPTRVLILAGTAQARELCQALADRADIAAIASLAGRTREPQTLPVPTRHGGFGGVAGLLDYLQSGRVNLLVDATHPFAAQMSANAAQACARAGVARLSFDRDPWARQSGDDWIEVDDLAAAARALGDAPKRVFLSQGRVGISAFKNAGPHRYVLRAVDPPAREDLPENCKVILGRGPFAFSDEARLLEDERIDIIVSKNSGGSSAKIDAARALHIPVVMIRRPAPPPGARVTTLQDALDWIGAHRAAP